jgi:hypothetical protein
MALVKWGDKLLLVGDKVTQDLECCCHCGCVGSMPDEVTVTLPSVTCTTCDPDCVLPAGDYVLTRPDPTNYPCCYFLELSICGIYTTITAIILNGSVGVAWSTGTCAPGFVFWSAGWEGTFSGTTRCDELSVTLTGDPSSFGVTPDPPGGGSLTS